MIRLLNTADFNELQTICKFGKQFAEVSGAGEFDDLSFLNFINTVLSAKRGKVFILEINNNVAGMLGVIATPCYFNRKSLRVQEAFWWVDPEYRNTKESIKLFNKVEEWATEINANQVMVSSTANLNADKLEKFYTKKGFRKMDINYVKDLKNA